MPGPISVSEFLSLDHPIVLDVRKAPARLKSGLAMPSANWRAPFLAEQWWHEFAGQDIIVFCVHGQEVSKAVAGFLCDQKINAGYLEGGFEAYREAGGAVEKLVEHE